MVVSKCYGQQCEPLVCVVVNNFVKLKLIGIIRLDYLQS